ncbi:MAG: acyltransferase family protein [bacterium]|nr:acyltransferase family protein [bacterium]
MKIRVKWVDTAKFLGIFAIYLGHFGEVLNKSLAFVYQFHVALFFLLSGCMSNYDKEDNVFNFIKKKFKNIMIPFFAFSLISLFAYVLLNNCNILTVLEQFKIILFGNIRNTFFAMSLWFLSCLFLMEVIFKVLRQLDSKLLILLISLIMFVIAEGFIIPRPIIEPHWFYNLDSVFYYAVFYAIGYIAYPFILKWFQLNTKNDKFFFLISSLILTIYAIGVFFGINYLEKILNFIPVIRVLTPIFTTLPLILFILILARLIDKINLFNEIGNNTLFLCCNEFIIKSCISSFCSAFSLSINFTLPIQVYLYTMLLLILEVKVIIPFEKKLINSIHSEFTSNKNS